MLVLEGYKFLRWDGLVTNPHMRDVMMRTLDMTRRTGETEFENTMTVLTIEFIFLNPL
jgi:hypothetical protein